MSRVPVTLLMALLLVVGTNDVEGGQFVIVNLDDANEGLNDPESVSPVGGNSGTTLGEQRMIVLEAAAERWAEFLDLAVEIRIGANFEELSCNSTSAVLGSAGPNFIDRDFPGAPEMDTWYSIAQADTLRGTDTLSSNQEHLSTRYNVLLDAGDSSCLGGNTWYYGLDGNVPSGTVPLFPVVLHELAHGLGFLTFVDLDDGSRLSDRNDAYMLFLHDQQTGKNWPEMSDQERADSAVNDPRVVWTGPVVDEMADMVTDPAAFNGGLLRMHAPDELESGSSISHWTPDANPPLLMEPTRQAGIFDEVDLTPALFADIGWPVSTLGGLIFRDRFEQ